MPTADGQLSKTIPLEILSSYEYDKKVANKQAWSNFWVALGEGMAASSAGYSSSTTTYNGNSHTSAYASAYGYAGNTYGYANAYGSAYTTTYGKAHTESYNGAAAYAAQQNARANVERDVKNAARSLTAMDSAILWIISNFYFSPSLALT